MANEDIARLNNIWFDNHVKSEYLKVREANEAWCAFEKSLRVGPRMEGEGTFCSNSPL